MFIANSADQDQRVHHVSRIRINVLGNILMFIANSADPDQMVPFGALLSGYPLFALD